MNWNDTQREKSRDRKIKDWLSKLSQPNWRLNNLYKVNTKSGKVDFFRENSVQAILNEANDQKKIILKARQMGISTNEILKMLDFVMFNRDKTAVILAHEQDAIKKLFRIVKIAYANFPEIIRPELDRGGGSKYEYYFPQMNSRIYCDLESRGDTIHWLHISEVAFIKDRMKILATLQALPIDGKLTFESTADGFGNYFHDIYTNPSPGIKPYFFPWFLQKEYAFQGDPGPLTQSEKDLVKMAKQKYGVILTREQILFRRSKLSELREFMVQEYPETDAEAFISSGNAIFDTSIISEQMQTAINPIEIDGPINIYAKINKDHQYAIGVDTSEGVGGDFSTAVVIDIDTMTQVADLRVHYKVYDFAHLLNKLASIFTFGGRFPPMMAIERNNHGHAVILELEHHLGYPNLYKSTDGRSGWITNAVSRPIMLNAFIAAIENKQLTILSKQVLDECLTLLNNNGKIEAATGKHDDLIIATCIALQVAIQNNTASLYRDIAQKIRV